MKVTMGIRFLACAVFAQFVTVSALFQGGGRSQHDLFLPRRGKEAGDLFDIDTSASSLAASLQNAGSNGVQHLRASLISLWDKQPDKAERKPQQGQPKPQKVDQRNATKATRRKTSKGPASRKQMYFRPVSVTLMCVMALTIASLFVYTALSISRNYDELSASFKPSTVTQCLTIAGRVANFAPMLCMLFVACRMYILATTEGLGEPPAWVKKCMWTAVAGVVLQFLVVVGLPAFSKQAAVEEAEYDMSEGAVAAFQAAQLEAKQKKEDAGDPDAESDTEPNLIEVTGEHTDVHPDLTQIEYVEGEAGMKHVFWTVQLLSLVLLYGGIFGVCYGILTFPVQSTKISPAVQCTILLSMLYFVVCLALWVARVLPESDFQTRCKNAALAMSGVVKKAPMFAVLFLASRMRALNLDPPYGMPPFWMQCCFYTITGLVYLETLAACSVGFIGKMEKAYYGVFIFKMKEKRFLHYIEHLSALTSYLLLIPVIIGVTMMPAQDGHAAPLSTTLKCVICFQQLYFGVMFVQGLVLFAEEAWGSVRPILRDAAVAAGISLSLAPLLSVLFVATRMRALQITQQEGAPPGWAQDCMFIAVFATGIQSVCCLVMPLFIGSACKVDEDGNPDYDLEPMIGAYAVAVVKYVALIALHGSVVIVCMSVYVMTPETANDHGRFLTSRKQIFEGILVTTCVFFVALLLSSAKVVGMAIKLAIESADKELLGVDITIRKVALNLFKGYVQINDLKIHQPEDEMIYSWNAKGKFVGTPTGEKNDWKYDYIAKVHLVMIKINLWRLLTTRGGEFELQNLSLTGVYLNVEKPDTDTKAHNANVEYIVNHMESLGLLPPPEKASSSTKKDDTKKKKEEEARKKKEEEAKKKDEEAKKQAELEKAKLEKEKDANGKDEKKKSDLRIILHKIEFGDIGVSVTVQKVKLLGEISFQPRIGKLGFDDIEREVFGGKSDLPPGEVVACIIKAVVFKIFEEVSQGLTAKLTGAAGDALLGMRDALVRSWYRIKGHHESDDA